jgi:hypothetical protein
MSVEQVVEQQQETPDTLMSRAGGIWELFLKRNQRAIAQGDTEYETKDSSSIHDSEKSAICTSLGFMFDISRCAASMTAKIGKVRRKGKANEKYDSAMTDGQRRVTLTVRMLSKVEKDQSFGCVGVPMQFVIRAYRNAQSIYAYGRIAKKDIKAVMKLARSALTSSEFGDEVEVPNSTNISESDITGYYDVYLNAPETGEEPTIPALVYDKNGALMSYTLEGLCDIAGQNNKTIVYNGIAALSISMVCVCEPDDQPGSKECPFEMRMKILRAGLLKVISK